MFEPKDSKSMRREVIGDISSGFQANFMVAREKLGNE